MGRNNRRRKLNNVNGRARLRPTGPHHHRDLRLDRHHLPISQERSHRRLHCVGPFAEQAPRPRRRIGVPNARERSGTDAYGIPAGRSGPGPRIGVHLLAFGSRRIRREAIPRRRCVPLCPVRGCRHPRRRSHCGCRSDANRRSLRNYDRERARTKVQRNAPPARDCGLCPPHRFVSIRGSPSSADLSARLDTADGSPN